MNNTINSNEKLKKVMKKTKRKMTFRIIKIFIICFALVMLVFNTPNFLYITQHSRIVEAQKVMMLSYQLSSNQDVVGYGEEIENKNSFNRHINLYTRNIVGHNVFDSDEMSITVPYNLISRKLDLYYPLMGNFMHQSRYVQLEEKYQERIEADNNRFLKAMEKNKDNTVSRVDLTFSNSYSIDEIYELIGDLDIDIQWFAIETGYEGTEPPNNISLPLQQYYQFGMPSKFYTPNTIFEPTIIQKDDIDAHLELVFETLDWLQEHDDLLYKDRFWFMNEDVQEKLESEGIKCYGITINAPTDQIIRLIENVQYNYINLQEITFWNW